MREAFFILLILFIILALTAIRYRKQIAGIIGFARMLKDAKNSVGDVSKRFPGDSKKSIALVNCAKCGVWVPQDKARKLGGVMFCSDKCLQNAEARV